MRPKIAPASFLTRFAKAEDGSMTIFGIFIFVCIAFIAGLTMDVTRLQARTVQMQNTADSAAFAAMMRRSFYSQSSSTTTALTNAAANMPTNLFGTAVGTADVQWGTWNASSRIFTPAAPGTTASGAVRVIVRQTAARGNPFRNTLLRMVGVPTFDVTRWAVASSNSRNCLREGFVSEQDITIRSNNTFRAGFCIHSNSGVKVSRDGSGGFLEAGVSVTAPSLANITGPDGIDSLTGLRQAAGEDQYPLHVLTQMQLIIDSLKNEAAASTFLPSYITNTTVQDLRNNRDINGVYQINNNNTLRAGNIYTATCNGSGKIQLKERITIEKVVLITDCQIQFGTDVAWESSIIASTNTDPDRAIVGASGMRLGVNDGCGAGGGTQILTMGGVDFSSSMTVYGGQILAQGNVQFSASGDGARGISIVAGGTISGTSGMEMKSCNGSGMGDNIRVPYVQIVQ